MAITITVKYERSDVQPGLQAYGLKATVTAATGMPKEVFIMRRDVQNANEPATEPDPSNPGILPDTFICLADPVDLEEVPVGAPDPIHEMPYYRVSAVELWFRSPDLLEETYNLLSADVAKLVLSLQSLGKIALSNEVVYG